MTAPIDDVTALPGKKLSDQEENTIGEIKEVYAIDGDGVAAWVTVEASFGMGNKRTVFIPLARIKDEDGDLLVPYSKSHIEQTPEIDASDGISKEDERQLRDHFGIDRADQELRSDNDSYATLVPEDEGTAKLVEDVDSLETPDADKVSDETRERLEDPGSAEIRHITAEDVTADGGSSTKEHAADEDTASDGDDESSKDESESSKDESGREKAEK
jgi:hypothetical protein